MKTPIFDFVNKYANEFPTRLHMPGHKGSGPLGVEKLDITEVDGADVLYHGNGIIEESQRNAALLFESAKTLYSTEGATLCIRAMLALVKYFADERDQKPIIVACRNAHKSFITGCALLDINPIFIESESNSLHTGKLSPQELIDFLQEQTRIPTALYITSPDYLGNMMDIKSISDICHEKGILLLVDNAHGAYLHFLPEPYHPLDLGADLVCDSAHKTLPVITGGAYLHISNNAPQTLPAYAEQAMSLFASTSPSYLIMQSLDLCNAYLSNNYKAMLYEFCGKIVDLKKALKHLGYQLIGDEPLKVTIMTKSYGYLGTEFSNILKDQNLIVEFSDPDYVVLMLSPELEDGELKKIYNVFSKIQSKDPILEFPPRIPVSTRDYSPREALLSANEILNLERCEGKILAQPGVTCPPAIPIAICGEVITKEHIKVFRYYGIEELSVKK